ncbi:hypothetical protein GCM10009532_29210 [Microbacterium aurantiacum]
MTVERVRAAWPDILGRLEKISRSSWLLAAGATVLAYADEVLSLSFTSAGDVAKFKQLQAGKGPSEDLRQAILAVLGVRVKYLARHDAAVSDAPQHGPDGTTAPTGGPDARRDADRPARGGGARANTTPAPASAAPVTDWAVAPIPSDDDAPPPDPGPSASIPPAQFPVDEEPEDIAATRAPARVATLAPAGEVPADTDPVVAETAREEEDDLDAPADVDVPPVVVPPAPTVTHRAAPRSDGVERYGEAVVRQVLGATFVREEPYEPPTRFS